MVKPTLRSRSIGTKVTEEEYARLEALAAGQSMSEWARETLLRAGDRRGPSPAEEALLAEVLALRTILLNALYKIGSGQLLSADEMQQLIDRADADKLKKAGDRLSR